MSSDPPKPIRRVSARKYRGLGDVVAKIAEPIARASDLVLKTNIQGCSACQKRRAKLNKMVPFK